MSYKVNLLPPQLQVEGMVDKRRLLKLAGAVLGGGIIVLGYGGFLASFLFTRAELSRSNQELNRLAVQLQAAEAVHNERVRLENTLKEFSAIVQGRKNWHTILQGIGNVCPQEVTLTQLEVLPAGGKGETAGKPPASKAGIPPQGSMVSIQGVASSFAAIGVFERQLWESGYFAKVHLVKVGTDDKGRNTFVIEAELAKGVSR
ncbi:PilN domain-containing protein [Desulfothermobacter acidiphilus]|uniref:PilN domain-containing protein n=1 Tax=Desulfothermobacter acidiphilus TaxID=1938353 RepID=UPI003F8AB317